MAESGDPAEERTFVLGLEPIRWGIGQLLERRTHPWFPAYLQLRRVAGQRGALDGLNPTWGDLGHFLKTPGGPSNKPYLRPFWHQTTNADQAWLNPNLAGSYSPASLRGGQAQSSVIEIEDSGFVLKPQHWRLALTHLLYEEPMPVIPLCLFLYRDFGFTTNGPSLGPTDLIEAFRGDFGYEGGVDDNEFETLYAPEIPERTDWFDPLASAEAG